MRRESHILVAIILPAFIAVLLMGAIDVAQAADYIKVPKALCGVFPCPEGNTGTAVAKNLVGRLGSNLRVIVGAVAILMIVVAGVKLVTNAGNEEVFTKQRDTVLYAVLGLFLIGLAGEIANIFEVGQSGGILDDPNTTLQKSRLFTRTVEIIITFTKYIIGSVAVLYIIRSALRLVMVGDAEEASKDKKSILYGLLGLVIILMANPIINKVFFKIDTNKFPGLQAVRPAIDTAQFAKEVAGVTNLVASIAGPFAILALVAGGLMYVIAAGEDDKIAKAKKIMTWAIIGIVFIYGAFAIVSTFVARRFEGI